MNICSFIWWNRILNRYIVHLFCKNINIWYWKKSIFFLCRRIDRRAIKLLNFLEIFIFYRKKHSNIWFNSELSIVVFFRAVQRLDLLSPDFFFIILTKSGKNYVKRSSKYSHSSMYNYIFSLDKNKCSFWRDLILDELTSNRNFQNFFLKQ